METLGAAIKDLIIHYANALVNILIMCFALLHLDADHTYLASQTQLKTLKLKSLQTQA